MNIEDCKTLPEFFGVEVGEVIWVEGYRYRVHEGWLYSRDRSSIDDGRVLVGYLTGQLKWSRHEPSEGEFGSCAGCGYEFNSELINEYEITHCPKCGEEIEESVDLGW